VDRIEVTVYLDTHVLVVLAEGHSHKLSVAARRAIDRSELLASPAVVLELQLLHEIGRLRITASKTVSALAADLGLRVCELPFRTVVEQALAETWARDPFDRLIVANAKAANAPLVTKDGRILDNYSRAIW
jgi:PIN domain nuclease of toxin-antitoxin system